MAFVVLFTETEQLLLLPYRGNLFNTSTATTPARQSRLNATTTTLLLLLKFNHSRRRPTLLDSFFFTKPTKLLFSVLNVTL